MPTQQIISKPTLAIIKNAIVDLCTHTELTNLFEQYDLEPDPTKTIQNKLGRASASLDHQDWCDTEVGQRLLNLLAHVHTERNAQSRYGQPVENHPAWQRIVKALDERESIQWNGDQFVARRSATLLHMADKVQSFNHDSVQREVQRLLANVDTDPADVLTSAKSLIESVCRAILADRGQSPVSNNPEFGPLTKQTLGQLQLLPDQVSNQTKGVETIKRILQNMGSLLQGLAEMRNLYGDAHGKGPGSKGLEPRHARLMAGMAGSLATFLMETHEQRQKGRSTK